MIFSAGPSIWYIAPAGGPVILTTQTLITQLHAPNVQSAAFSFSSYLPLILSYQVEKKKEPQFASLSSSNHLLIDALRHPCLFTLAVQTSNVACIPRAANSPSSPHASPARCGGPTRQEGGGPLRCCARAGGGAAWDGGGHQGRSCYRHVPGTSARRSLSPSKLPATATLRHHRPTSRQQIEEITKKKFARLLNKL